MIIATSRRVKVRRITMTTNNNSSSHDNINNNNQPAVQYDSDATCRSVFPCVYMSTLYIYTNIQIGTCIHLYTSVCVQKGRE